MKRVKTSELIDAALDWAAAVCLGAVWQPKSARASFFIWPGTPVKYSAHAPRYSTDWAQGGPIIDREQIDLMHAVEGSLHWNQGIKCTAHWRKKSVSMQMYCGGPTSLIAAMRCYVASKLGDEVDVPEELVK